MPDSRRHRSAAPRDRELFAPAWVPALREAVAHLSWLLTHGYGEASARKLVGDRFDLAARQRDAVARCACSDAQLADRAARRVAVADLRGRALVLDGYNVLTTVEVALGGGVVLLARDGCARDLASRHGTWRRAEETGPALELVGELLEGAGTGPCAWLLDAPVSNSGRLAALLRAAAARRGWSWSVELVADADRALIERGALAASADSRVLDGCGAWIALAREVVAARVPGAWTIDLG